MNDINQVISESVIFQLLLICTSAELNQTYKPRPSIAEDIILSIWYLCGYFCRCVYVSFTLT